ncbi:MAG: hypothetical protein R2718_13155 [Solirubrobacterales bacterium]|nr:hypothetical protein [Solirubrobacterales bacterium]
MSEANVEIVRWLYEEGHAKRTVDAPGAEDRVAPDYVFHSRPDFPSRPAYRLDQLPEFWADLDATFDDYSLTPLSYEPIGPAHVLVTMEQAARLRGSDQRLSELVYMLWHLTDGKAKETWTSTVREQVLEVAGLSE